MKAADKYLNQLEKWDTLATEQKWQPEWVEQQGEAIAAYLTRCIKKNSRPSFSGLMLYLHEICPKADDAPTRSGGMVE